MLNKIIKELEAKYKVASESQKYATDAETTDYYTGQCIGINEAISIIKAHESEFEQEIKKAFLASKLELSDYKSAQDYYNQNYKNE